MIDRNELDLIYRTQAWRAERINAEGYQTFEARPKRQALRRTLALAALRAGRWLDPTAGSTSSERPAEPLTA